MKIAILTTRRSRFAYRAGEANSLGGIEAACVELAQALVRRGHGVHLACETPADIHIPGVPCIGFDDLGGLDGDVALACNEARYLEMLSHRHRVVWMHNPLSLAKAWRKKELMAMARIRAHAVFGSEFALLNGSNGLPFRSRTAIPLGIDATFQADLPPVDTRRPVFIWVSQPQRGLKTAIAAWIEARSELAEGFAAEFHIYSASPADADLTQDSAASLGIHFLPRANKAKLLEAYRQATALISLGAHDETFCLAAAEAIASGLPVLTHGTGSLSERVQHGVSGLISHSTNALVWDIVRLCRDPELTDMLSKGARSHRQDYGWDRVAKLWESYLMALP